MSRACRNLHQRISEQRGSVATSLRVVLNGCGLWDVLQNQACLSLCAACSGIQGVDHSRFMLSVARSGLGILTRCLHSLEMSSGEEGLPIMDQISKQLNHLAPLDETPLAMSDYLM